MGVLAVLGVVLVVAFQLLASSFSYPWHASCKIKWTVPVSCDSFRSQLVDQINGWSSEVCPMVSETCPKMPCGQKCKYSLTGNTPAEILAEHRTPVADYMDRLSFDLVTVGDDASACSVEAFSTSSVWYAVLDFGTNYCNLRNLVDGAGISSLNGFQEDTSTAVCTQLDSIDCERY